MRNRAENYDAMKRGNQYECPHCGRLFDFRYQAINHRANRRREGRCREENAHAKTHMNRAGGAHEHHTLADVEDMT